jgi:aminopeptidase N
MKINPYVLIFSLFLGYETWAQKKIQSPVNEPGVSRDLAQFRKSILRDIQYELNFTLPPQKDQGIEVEESVKFQLLDRVGTLPLDFKQGQDRIHYLKVNGMKLDIPVEKEHILIPGKLLKMGYNQIQIGFTAGDEALNRNPDYLYSLLVPDRARSVFPSFDQPDLKARFLLSLKVPKGWKVLANGKKKDTVSQSEATIFHFQNSDLLPTYLFSFAAGKFRDSIKTLGNRPMEFLFRESDSTKIRLSLDSVFEAHFKAIQFLENWTVIPFPFQKIGFVGIPDFQFGGMEHPGEVQYRASALFLDKGATKDEFLGRSNVISHETAHMWFGDMVTMRWFNDVWMKEVFANFMADKVMENKMGPALYPLRFFQSHYPSAYSVDRTRGANPIRQELTNLKDAGSLYGDIIYNKAPIMMRQLELWVGKENFQKGIRAYLKKYAYKNADWEELIAELSRFTTKNLYAWNKVWVNQPGRPIFYSSLKEEKGRISQWIIKQKPEFGPLRSWPQHFSISLIYPDHQTMIPVDIQGQSLDLVQARGLKVPDALVFNSDGLGYGVFPLDRGALNGVFGLGDALERTSIIMNAYENMLNGNSIRPKELLEIYSKGLSQEKDEMNLRLLTGYIRSIYWKFINPSQRETLAQSLEEGIQNSILKQKTPNNKKILFKTFQDVFLTRESGRKLYRIWETQQAPPGITLNEEDYTSLAINLVLRSDSDTHIVEKQIARIGNPDRKDRLIFLIPPLSSDKNIRDSFFYSLSLRKNRAKEARVITALGILNHPLRQNTSMAYLPMSLNLVVEIQKTGDLFFPQYWLGAVFGNYQSRQAYQIADDFLGRNPKYPPKLKAKILQATDDLYRAQKLLKGD